MKLQLFLAQADLASPGLAMQFLPIVLIIGIFYLLIYRPMRTRQKKLDEMVGSLKNGDKVITNGGIYGTVAGTREHTFVLKVGEQVKFEVARKRDRFETILPGRRLNRRRRPPSFQPR